MFLVFILLASVRSLGIINEKKFWVKSALFDTLPETVPTKFKTDCNLRAYVLESSQFWTLK